MATKQPHLLFKKTWVDFLKEEFSNDPEMTMQIFFAICDYAYEGIVPENSSLRLAIGTIRREIDNDKQAYNELSEKRRNVRLGAIEKKKNEATIVDFVEENTTNTTNSTKETTATNVDNIIYNNISNSTSSKDDSELQKNKRKNTKKEIVELTPEEEQFNVYMNEHFARVQKMDKPIKYKEYCKLVEKYGEDLVLSKLSSMNNHKELLKKYVSAYDTLSNWCKLEIDRNGNNIKSNKPKRDITAAVVEDFFGVMQ